MSNVALRDYQRNIERLIENHQIDEALSHCLNIVQLYPKEIETYRKLGKIFLEKQEYATAEKVFNIILSVFPDDFVANIGLSFINEQNNRMDQAIQHMQYAFELQPANESLQDELKRLFNKRDHVEPAKIRLTRGALIKMYTRSDLFEQAIAEIRLGLYEKPGRMDYKLALADMLWKSGKNIDAVETCVDIISHLPYCWVANEILDKAFLELNQNETDNHYRSRLIELNPYYQYMLPTTKNIADIPDIAVQISEELPETLDVSVFNWGEYLNTTWSAVPAKQETTVPVRDLEWSSILDEALDESSPPQSKDIKNVTETSPKPSWQADSSSNKRQAFIDRLQKRSAAQEKLAEIPNWVLEESQLNQVDSAEEMIPDAEANESPALLEQNDQVAFEEIDLPEIQAENGIIDHDVPVQIPDEISSSSQWVQDQTAVAAPKLQNHSLQDTQQIQTIHDTPREMLDQARKAIQGGNLQYALKNLHNLAENDEYLPEIRDILENACEIHPSEANLWLTLGGIYQRLNMKEKALEVFIRAQKQISL